MPARIDRIRLVAKNGAARIAVVRVSTLVVPRLDMKPPPPPAHAEAAAFGFLQQDQADHGEHDHEMDDDDDGLHSRSAQAPRRADGPLSVPHIGIRSGLYTILRRISTLRRDQR